jgi:pimeloyl-ACP methyl ester carboxylesterase
MWEYQIDTLVQNNFRVIAYDRRGFGKSSQPWDGYDYDTLTDDLKAIIETGLKNTCWIFNGKFAISVVMAERSF